MFWLSHHHPDELNRCYRFGALHVCARCLGTYPVLFAVFLLQFALRAPLTLAHEVPVVLALTAPALADWAWGRFRPEGGSNGWRTLTGIALGVALGRTLFVHVQRPLPPALLAQLGLVTAVAGPVILATYRRRRGG
ncbi:MAG: DUF2085 domain-containing protein [Archangiaceae bacterium]|nr:DUF2085 domain-containing protein [Archangiaceae bacterium]